SSEVSDSAVAGKDALSQSEGLPEGTTLSGPDPDSFSDSYSHIIPSPDEPSVEEGRTEKTGEEAEPELRRRRSLLAVLERIGRTDEEEEGEEEFQLPQREVDSGLSVNKCILGAVILLGIGTIFFSGRHPHICLELGQPENSMQDSAGSTETQSKKPRDDQQEKGKYVKKDTIDIDERKERNKSEWKEGEKRERKDGGKTEWKQGNHEQGKFDKENDKDGKQKRHGDETIKLKEKEWKKEKTSRGDEGKPWKDKEGNKEWIEKSERKERKEEKDWKKGNHENLKDGKQWRSKEEKKDWKVGKDHGGKHRGKEEEKEWKVGKDHGGKHKGKEEWKEEKEWKVGKDHGGKHKGKEEWKEEKEWKKGKDGFEESGKEKWGKKDLKKKELKKNDGDWKSKNGKDRSKEVKGERKQWEENINHGKERKGKNERKQWNAKERKSKNGKDDEEWRKKDERKPWEKDESWKKDKKPNGDWKKDRSSSQSHKDEHKRKVDHGHREEQMWGDAKLPHTHSRPSQEQPEYWDQQRHRLQHNSKPPQQCSSVETCAHTEELLPVPFPEFEVVLQTYLAKAEEAGVEESKREELRKLAAEFFRDGVFVHDQTSFKEFVKDLGDILEDMVEGDDEAEEEDSDKEDEMEEFEREVMKKFSVPGAVEKEWRKESGRGRG
uniref:Pre-B-cell leukemia homeobox interacting protein 1b n=1 Tax=Cyclopterus lumpus TaxID=8103 RepID=A0A8C3G022_CYCLU